MAMMKNLTTQGQEPGWKRIEEIAVLGPDGHELYVIEVPLDLTLIPRKKSEGQKPVRITLPGTRHRHTVLTHREDSAFMPICYMLFGFAATLMAQYLQQ